MTDPSLWARAGALFDAALETDPSERTALVVREAGPDEALRDRVLAMLAADAAASPVLDASAREVADTVTPELPRLEGRRIGPYRITRIIGRGGMGIVCLAEREDVGKQVALKLVAGGLGSPDRITRFLRERRVLAQLDHPNIARLLDAGVGEDGSPWFAMEYVAGEAVDRWCARRSLPLDARLVLFERICAAVGYAHRHLVIHRDLKPANILVDDGGEPRLVDFGIAKLLDDDDDGTLTAGPRPMTPSYASPEQVRGEPVTTASDVHQLGALLFELLTGRRHTQGRRPSQAAGGEPAAPIPAARLAGDLDVIVAKATDVDPARRYASADELALDVARHRQGLPIEARPATAGYRFRKLIARHKATATAATLALVALVGFAVLMTVERRRTEIERARATAVASLLAGLFSQADPRVARNDSVTVRSVLDRGLARVRSGAGTDPVLKARILSVIAEAYYNLGQLTRAVEVQSEVVALMEGAVPPRDAGLLDARLELSAWLAESGDKVRAASEAAAVLEIARDLPASRRRVLARAHRFLGFAYQVAGRYPEASAQYDTALATYRSLPDFADRDLERLLINRGFLAQTRGDLATAEANLREVHRRRLERLGPDSLETAAAAVNLGAVLQGPALAEAEELIRSAVAVQAKAFSGPHRERVSGLNALARVLGARNKPAEAEAAQREALGLARTIFGDRSPALALGTANLAGYVQAQGRLAEASALHGEAVERYRAALGPDDPSTATAMTNLAWSRSLEGRHAVADSLYRVAIPILDSTWKGTTRIVRVLIDQAIVRRRSSRCGDAEPILRRALELAEPSGPRSIDVIRAQRTLGGCYLDLGRYQAAEPLLIKAHENLVAALGPDNRFTREAAEDLEKLAGAMKRTAAGSTRD